MFKRILFGLTLCSFGLCSFVNAQDCAPPAIVANAKSSNLFSPEQEMIVGELTFQNLAVEMRFVRDEMLVAYIKDLGDALAKHLPVTGLKFQFHLVEIPVTNAFNIPGGHVLISRKLVAFVNNEDELAGVIAHELGHAVVRHSATDISEWFKKILNVNSVGDRKDITNKYNLMIERWRTKRLSRNRGHEDEQQLEADKIGLFAMVAAGYDPNAFSAFFDRLTEGEGKAGNWFSDFFGSLRPEQKRLREMIRATQKLPMACRAGRSAKATENFSKWQADVVSFRAAAPKEELPGLIWRKELAPKLRSDVWSITFSEDGKRLLVQDDFAITVIEREPLQVLFQIPVENANEATFTPDGKHIVFATENLRYEKWSVAEREAIEMRELAMRSDCWEHKLSPDGNYLACVDRSARVNIVDTRTGLKIWEKENFYRLTAFEFYSWFAATRGEDRGRTNFFRVEFSPDSRFVMVSRSNKYRYSFGFEYSTTFGSKDAALALDLTKLKATDMGGDLKKISARPYVFLDSGRIVGRPDWKSDDAGIFSFPDGKRLHTFAFAAEEVKRTSNPEYVVIKPLADAKLGFFDLKKGIVAGGLGKEDAALWNNLMVYEAANGRILLREVKYNETAKGFDSKDVGEVEIPVGSISNLKVAQVSDNFSWLMLSSKTRGGVWNLESGERKFHVRGFKGGVVDNGGTSVGDFPKLIDSPHSLVLMNSQNNTIVSVRNLPDQGARQYGRFLLLRRSLKEKEKKNEKPYTPYSPFTPPPPANDESDSFGLGQDVRFELKDIILDKVIWSHDFAKEAPQFSFDEFSGRLIFYWRLNGETGRAKLKESVELQAKADALGHNLDDYLVEIVDAFAQKTVGKMLLETGKGSFDIGKGLSEGNWLVLRDSEGRTLIYSMREGELRHRFFGSNAAINPTRNQIVVENFPGEIALYDLDTGDRQASFIINGSAAFVRFNLEGDKLFVLSNTQSVYAFDLSKLAVKPAAQPR